MLSIVALTIAHCNVCIDPKKPNFTEKPAILKLILIIHKSNVIWCNRKRFNLTTMVKLLNDFVPNHIQIKSDETAQLLNKPYVNDVYLTGQNLT